MLNLNLQLFAEDDLGFDDDFVADTPEAEYEAPEAEEPTETVETETETPSEPVTPEITPQTLKLKFNHEEREVSVEEAQMLAQKGMNYEKAVERARQEARDAYIAEQNYTWNGKPITNEAQYKEAIREQELIEQYNKRGLPEEVVQELVENRRFRETFQTQQQQQEQQQQEQRMYNEFFDYFESLNGRRFDSTKDTLPTEVLQAMNSGQPLKYAYMEHHNKQLVNQLKISKQNETNRQKAPMGSVTGYGNNAKEASDPFLDGFMGD